MTYGKDLKECAVRFFQNNHTYEETEEVFGMAKSTLYEWVKEAAAGFPEKPKRTCEKKIDKAALIKALADKPDSELSELAKPFGCTQQAVFYALERLGITRKKRRLHIPKNPRSLGKNIL
jgi:transposase-like protein